MTERGVEREPHASWRVLSGTSSYMWVHVSVCGWVLIARGEGPLARWCLSTACNRSTASFTSSPPLRHRDNVLKVNCWSLALYMSSVHEIDVTQKRRILPLKLKLINFKKVFTLFFGCISSSRGNWSFQYFFAIDMFLLFRSDTMKLICNFTKHCSHFPNVFPMLVPSWWSTLEVLVWGRRGSRHTRLLLTDGV